MKKKFYFGSNLKMYQTVSSTMNYLYRLEELTKDISREETELFILPSFVGLERAVREINPGLIKIGAQTMFWEEEGPFTGEISPVMLSDMGVLLVMAGHSERRHTFGETSQEEGRRVLAAVRHGMTALLCVGETRDERAAGISKEVIREQLKTALYQIAPEDSAKIRIAYEPAWAIGASGKPAEPACIEDIHEVIKETLSELFQEAGKNIPVLYGGSVNLNNAPTYGEISAVDGLFVGRAAWNADKFNELIRETLKNLKAGS